MAAPQNFRTAFNGFNREDVVHYLEYINTKHNTEINKLTSDAESLRAQLDALRSRSAVDLQSLVDSLRDECAELKAQLEEAQAANEALEQQLAEAKAANEALAQPKEVPAADTKYREEELEAYRRAERTERLARERADQLYRLTNGVLADAAVKVDGVVEEVGTIADQVMAQLTQLQNAVGSSKKALQDAADIMYTLRPDNREL